MIAQHRPQWLIFRVPTHPSSHAEPRSFGSSRYDQHLPPPQPLGSHLVGTVNEWDLLLCHWHPVPRSQVDASQVGTSRVDTSRVDTSRVGCSIECTGRN